MNRARCVARRDDGTTCGERATIAHQHHAGMVCVEHAEDKPALHEGLHELDSRELPSDPTERDRVLDEQDRIEYRLGQLDAGAT